MSMLHSAASSESFVHTPVMLQEILEVFAAVPSGLYVDATLGGAGHAKALLEQRNDRSLLGIDRDVDALAVAKERLAAFDDRVQFAQAKFGDIAGLLQHGEDKAIAVACALFDLGVSSPQLDRAERGFAFRHPGPLDMRMSQDENTMTARDIVNNATVEDLAKILQTNADERFAFRIANAIVAARPLETTTELAEVVVSAIPAAVRRKGGHPATKTFQALRIAVNNELEQIEPALVAVLDALVVGGRCAVLAYHSGEDRIVKDVLRNATGGFEQIMPGMPVETRKAPAFRLLWRGAKKATDLEVQANYRAASARLRVIERIAA